jgi:hypothetical protein
MSFSEQLMNTSPASTMGKKTPPTELPRSWFRTGHLIPTMPSSPESSHQLITDYEKPVGSLPPQPVFPMLGSYGVAAKHALFGPTRISNVKAVFHHSATDELSTPRGSKNLWPLLRSYKTDHVSSKLPSEIYSNASVDNRLWTQGPLTPDHCAWHHYQFLSGDNLLQHPSCSFN